MTISTLDNFRPDADTCIAIGVFDGVHLGHQRVLALTGREAAERGLAGVGLTFDPHPVELIAPERAQRYLCSLSQRVEWMSAPGMVGDAVVARFDREFAALSAREFVERVLVERMRARVVRVGADFRFGRGREGGVMDLESMGDRYGFEVDIIHAVSRGGERVSSTRIRSLVEGGDTERAAALLGRPFTIRGSVVEGKRLGRTIGYPTANLKPEAQRQLLPANGIYAGSARVVGREERVRAAISVGTNPTTDAGDERRKVEAFLMDGFDGDLYGQSLDLGFAARIRDEVKFETLDALVAQMARDVDAISAML